MTRIIDVNILQTTQRSFDLKVRATVKRRTILKKLKVAGMHRVTQDKEGRGDLVEALCTTWHLEAE